MIERKPYWRLQRLQHSKYKRTKLLSGCCLPPDAGAADAQSTPSSSSSASRQPFPDSDRATQEFIDFLKSVKSGREIFKQCRAFTEGMVYKRVSFDPSRRYYSRFNSLCVYGHVYALTQDGS